MMQPLARSNAQRRRRRAAIGYRRLTGAISIVAAVAGCRQSAPSKSEVESSVVPLGVRLSIDSKILHESREVVVSTPPNYARSTERFPVLYVLDGGENLLTTVSAARALASAGRMPPAIVVAISNTKRDRDFTPKLVRTTEPPPGVTTIGGADAFLKFIGRELIPTIDAKYRTQPMRTLIAHSLGGLLAMRALATAPSIFRGYVTLEPSLWWDARQPVQEVLDSLKAHPATIGRLAAVEGTSDEGWKPDWEALRKVAPPQFHLSFVHIDNESHENLPYRGIYEGLAALYGDYMPAMRHDLAQGNLLALLSQYASLSRDFGYSVKPPLGSILNIANKEANQRRFDEARRSLAVADSLYPGSADTKSFRAGVEEAAAEAARNRLGPLQSTVQFKPTSRAAAIPFLGSWEALVKVEPGSPMRGAALFYLRADTLFLRFTARGVAIDGGDLTEPPAPVRIDGKSITWERENAGGGRAVTSARLTANGKIEGTEKLVGGREMPTGFTAPRVTIEMTKR